MPEMNGCMVARQIRAWNRNIRIILYSGAFRIPENEIINVDVFVPKGMGAAALLAQISELMHARRGSNSLLKVSGLCRPHLSLIEMHGSKPGIPTLTCAIP
ncbi:hypothetical protein JAO29_05960 [Edaphobacter sp. HDX4]